MQKSIDPAEGIMTVKILPGEFYVTKDNERIETILGSCIAACVRDPIAGLGGMNHFMLPVDKKASGAGELSDANRYGNYAMENLVNALLSKGARRERLEFKLFGGGRIMASMTNIGWYNIGFAFDYIYTEGFKIVAQDIGDVYPRKVIYYPNSGRARVRRLNKMHNESLAAQENQYIHNIESKPVEGDVELF
ncbi:putative chemoreceptor glutamine deamidase CheD 1 [Thiosulfatimonas sediminis]|uniref:Probable chemoreceptor glutamine deamidase CheD n=1 Tax=Thiosulfatimonas sediminis TaxID=2675054 RepID=A0A6F8PTS2_9GAMM|nr:chemoreceptor glutamine deamidase CheD [Thiosulfatimonas sediminis]BBP45414.1 putative chemoreceptor glutamine deamidase CheD 1 [Thiosulfatimonas sediminis]